MIKVGRWTYTPKEFDRMSEEAKRRGEAELRTKPLAVSVRYDHRRAHVIVKLNNGCTLTVPTELLQGLRGARARDLKQVKVMGPGLAIEWVTLDMQFTVSGLFNGVFGTDAWMEQLGRRARRTRTPQKVRTTRRGTRRARSRLTR
jgi:hypothetical protein